MQEQVLGRRILVVEDDASHAEAVFRILTEAGYETAVAFSGDDALALARAVPPDLVILDVRLPDLDGFAVAERLAADAGAPCAAFLFVSGNEDLARRVRRFALSEVDFLQKPYHIDDLLTRVERCLRSKRTLASLRHDAQIDELTGLGNLRLLHERLAYENSRVERYGTPLAVVMADVDGLKAINDNHGHTAGSAVLQGIGQALASTIRDTDVAARYGGDEFVVLLPHTNLASGIAFAERALDRIRSINPCGLTVSVSLGVAAFDPRLDSSSGALLERADRAAYRAKRQGGNRVVADGRPETALRLVD